MGIGIAREFISLEFVDRPDPGWRRRNTVQHLIAGLQQFRTTQLRVGDDRATQIGTAATRNGRTPRAPSETTRLIAQAVGKLGMVCKQQQRLRGARFTVVKPPNNKSRVIDT